MRCRSSSSGALVVDDVRDVVDVDTATSVATVDLAVRKARLLLAGTLAQVSCATPTAKPRAGQVLLRRAAVVRQKDDGAASASTQRMRDDLDFVHGVNGR